MTVKVEKLPAGRIQCTVEIPEDQRARAEQTAAQKLGRSVKVDGFRDGKAPLDVLKGKIKHEDLLRQIVHEFIPEVLRAALEQSGAKPIMPPKVSVATENPLVLILIFVEPPLVKLAGPDAITVEKEEPKAVDQPDVDAFIRELFISDLTETSVDRPARTGDLVRAEIRTENDAGKPVETLSAPNIRMTVGRHELPIPDLDELLTGMKKGETKSANIAFPADCEQPELKGKKAKVTARVLSVATVTMPALTPEFLKQRLKMDTTSEAFAADVRRMLTEHRTDGERQRREQAFYDEVQKRTKLEIAPELLEAEVQKMVDSLQHQLKDQNMTIEDWLKGIGKSADAVMKDMRKIASGRITLRFGLKELLEQKKVEMTDDEMKAAIEVYTQSHRSHGHAIPEAEWKPGSDTYEQIRWEQSIGKLVRMYVE